MTQVIERSAINITIHLYRFNEDHDLQKTLGNDCHEQYNQILISTQKQVYDNSVFYIKIQNRISKSSYVHIMKEQ